MWQVERVMNGFLITSRNKTIGIAQRMFFANFETVVIDMASHFDEAIYLAHPQQGELKCSQADAVPGDKPQVLRPACDAPNASAVGLMSADGGQPPADAACHESAKGEQ